MRRHFVWLASKFLLIASFFLATNGCGQQSVDRASPVKRENTTQPVSSIGPGSTKSVRTVGTAKLNEIGAEASKDNFEGWESEAFTASAMRVFHHMDQWINDRNHPMEHLLGARFHATPLRPDKTEPASASTIRTWQATREQISSLRERSVDFHAAMSTWLRPFERCDEIHAKFKIVDVQVHDESAVTRQFVTLTGRASGDLARVVESHSMWLVEWTGGLEAPQIASIRLQAYEEAESDSTLFVDCTSSVIPATEKAIHQQMSLGTPQWSRRIEGHLDIHQFGHNGLAIADVNNDGLDDIYICQPGGLPNRLLVQQPDGSTRSVADNLAVDYLDNTRSAIFADLDNDGDQDLMLAQEHWVLFLENDGSGKMTERNRVRADQVFSMVAADVDNNGFLDLYLCVYNGDQEQVNEIPVPFPMYDANNGGRNRLVRNLGDWAFEDATAELGLDENNSRFSFAAHWTDLDNDGDLDLYIANDFGRNNLYENRDGHFLDIADTAGVVDAATGMSVSIGDFDRDGHSDIYVSNMFSSAGNRITGQPEFLSNSNAPIDKYKYIARGNSLFKNLGESRFDDVSETMGVTLGRWAWASQFVDFDNDGWQDLMVANGFLTGDSAEDL